jgi:hypothetical protein
MKNVVLAMTMLTVLLVGTDSALAAPPGAIPVYCAGTALEGEERLLTCRRADTRAVVTPVPADMFLHITDILVNPNNVATSGVYSLVVGRDDAGEYPGLPYVDLLGEAAGSYHFSTPYLVFRNGEDIASRAVPSSQLLAIDVRASGYLASQVSP